HTFFLVIIRHTTILTPFPYTTLFRSVTDAGHPISIYQLLDRLQEKGLVRGRTASIPPILGVRPVTLWSLTPLGRQCAAAYVPGGDRKSTRLNSSHRTISYAVFCLKKK